MVGPIVDSRFERMPSTFAIFREILGSRLYLISIPKL